MKRWEENSDVWVERGYCIIGFEDVDMSSLFMTALEHIVEKDLEMVNGGECDGKEWKNNLNDMFDEASRWNVKGEAARRRGGYDIILHFCINYSLNLGRPEKL
jgi:hypothetical protein